MVKKILVNFCYSLGLTIAIMTLLFLTQKSVLNHIVLFLRHIRGTSEYEGESKGLETMNIIFGIVLPIVFVISLAIVVLVKRKKNTKIFSPSASINSPANFYNRP